MSGTAVDLTAVNGGAASGSSGVAHATELLAFTEAVMGSDDAELTRRRAAVQAVLSPDSYVDVAAIIAAFNVVDRVADATGIPLDEMMVAMSGDVRAELGLARFTSAANSRATLGT